MIKVLLDPILTVLGMFCLILDNFYLSVLCYSFLNK